AGKDVDLDGGGATFAINGIDVTPATSSVLLAQTKDGFVLEVRGKDGEQKAGHTYPLRLQHRNFVEPLDGTLQTRADGPDQLVVRVANATKSTRVHVVATRFLPPFDAFRDLAGAPAEPDRVFETERTPSTYHSGRKLGDEYRYVLERRFAAKYPGNMLRRP